MAKKFTISPKALAKLHAYVDNCKIEVSGFGYVDKNNHIHDVFITKQKCSASETDLDIPDLHQHILHLMDTAPELVPQIKFHWHSHVNMGVFWSDTDIDNIEGFNNSWMLFAVFNKRHEMLTKLRIYEPIVMDLDEVDIEPTLTLSEEEIKEIKGELKNKVTGHRYRQGKFGSYYYSSQYQNEQMDFGYIEDTPFSETLISKRKKYITLKQKIKKDLYKKNYADIEKELSSLGIFVPTYKKSKIPLVVWKREVIELLDKTIARL
jgi:hypothetical protein